MRIDTTSKLLAVQTSRDTSNRIKYIGRFANNTVAVIRISHNVYTYAAQLVGYNGDYSEFRFSQKPGVKGLSFRERPHWVTTVATGLKLMVAE